MSSGRPSKNPDENSPLLPTEVEPKAFRRKSRKGLSAANRMSVRGSLAAPHFESSGTDMEKGGHKHLLHPVDALAPLVAGGVITSNEGYTTEPRPPSAVKSLPTYAPFRRMARHRSFYLWWINEFRHWWKSSRLLVRLAGLITLVFSIDHIAKMLRVVPYKRKHKAMEKNSYRALKVVKRLGQGGPMRFFLDKVHPMTRSLRILVGAWRWVESAQCRRGEVGVEEGMAFIGNRVSRMLARTFVDLLVLWVVMPSCQLLFHGILPLGLWHPITLFTILGILRACAPYAASFQGSRVGRVLTRAFFAASKHRWQPLQRVTSLNLTSDDCCEKDEISQSADLAKLAKLVAKALGTAQQIGVDGLEGQSLALSKEGFKQIGAGSGGYAVYECHRRIWNEGTGDEGEVMTILLHVTPYGPSILDVMPRYAVLEFEDSVDRRSRWSEFISKQLFEGPPLLEGYCYQGAFFSPHHFAEMKTTYDKQLLAYDSACRALCKPSTGRNPNPPTDLLTLKTFLADGKRPRVQKRNRREGHQLQNVVDQVTKKLKSMMALESKNPDACCAPRGVILYFEGLDCSGKSSTGGLVEQALKDAGFKVQMRQHNRPPTPAQKLRPWMDRFEPPPTTVAVVIPNGEDGVDADKLLDNCVEHGHHAMVWDRGPAGDFVYGALAKATPDERKARFEEFMEFDRECFEKRILFCKLLFVTNRDSIASTLGKRLAQKKMARDLRTWLKASRGDESVYGETGFEGLDEIDLHIDPTDFVAFNSYQRNLRIFTNFCLNTDSESNPWIVVNTTDRFSARKQLLSAFSIQLDRFKTKSRGCGKSPATEGTGAENTPALTEAEMMDRGFKRPLPIKVIVSLAGLLFLIFYYCEHTQFGDTLVWWVKMNRGNMTEVALDGDFLLRHVELMLGDL